MAIAQKEDQGIFSRLIFVLSVFICLFHIYITLTTSIGVMRQRVFHTFCLMLLWYLYQVKRQDVSKAKRIGSWFLVAYTFIIAIYYVIGTQSTALMQKGIWGISTMDAIIGLLFIVLILEISRETIGIALPIIAIIFLVYAIMGPFLPEMIAHRGYDIPYITSYICWTNEGIFGTPIGAAVSFVVLYIIFGELLDQFGAGKFFIDLSYALTGRMRGGPAEASVLSSALMGSINGSAVANVVTTGTFTIPLMKQVGYRKEYAGAVEAVASTGGQILPPVMGAAAFVMADMTGIAYSTIIISALIPGILYYVSLGIAVYLEAGRMGIKPEKSTKLKNAKLILKEGWFHLIPLAVLLICLLGFGFSANYSAIFAIVTISIVGIIRSLFVNHKFPWTQFKNVAIHASKGSIAVSVACASAGIVIGIVSMTGLGVRFAQIVFDLSGGKIFLMLLMSMVACIILGMGLPSTAAYVIAATVAAPALTKAGISVMASNLFVFYFAIISFITPPVAIAAYAAAGLAESDTMKTGLQAFLLGIAGFVIPFLFVYHPGILILGTSAVATLWACLVSLCSVVMMAVCVEGWWGKNLRPSTRLVCFLAATLSIIPNSITGASGVALALILVLSFSLRLKIVDN